MLLDSNIIIYAAQPHHSNLRRFIAEHATAVSAASYVEVLGYHRLTMRERRLFSNFFATSTVLSLNQPVLDQAVTLRQRRKITLGDALVAATAVVNGLTLVTHNTADFAWIEDLQLVDPLEPT